MMRILQCLVWIAVMAGMANTKRSSHSYWQYARTNAFPETQSHHNYELQTKPTSKENVDSVDHRTLRIKNGVSLAQRGAIEYAEDHGVFPDETAESTFLNVPEECKEQGYCRLDQIPDSIKKHVFNVVKRVIKFAGENTVQDRFHSEELDTNITYRAGGDTFEPCTAIEQIVSVGLVPDSSDEWYKVAQSENKKYQQNFRVGTCNFNTGSGRKCDNRIVFDKSYDSECVQNYSYRDVWVIVKNNETHIEEMVKKFVKLPTCCSCRLRYK